MCYEVKTKNIRDESGRTTGYSIQVFKEGEDDPAHSIEEKYGDALRALEEWIKMQPK